MPWNSISPVGSISVKANRPKMQENTSYIETTMGNSIVGTNTTSTRDHFWNVGSDEDGRHRFIQSPDFTVGGNPADPVIGTGMDGVMYLRQDSALSARIQGFYRNAQGIYEFIPSFESGTTGVITGSYTNVVAVPANTYGEIMMYTTTESSSDRQYSSCVAHYWSNGTVARAWTFAQGDDDQDSNLPLKFANSNSAATNLFLRAKANDAANNLVWNYRITWRVL